MWRHHCAGPFGGIGLDLVPAMLATHGEPDAPAAGGNAVVLTASHVAGARCACAYRAG
jgi:hypothetical protein